MILKNAPIFFADCTFSAVNGSIFLLNFHKQNFSGNLAQIVVFIFVYIAYSLYFEATIGISRVYVFSSSETVIFTVPVSPARITAIASP